MKVKTNDDFNDLMAKSFFHWSLLALQEKVGGYTGVLLPIDHMMDFHF